MDSLMRSFIDEARELIEQSGQTLIALEDAPANAELVDALFRYVHTLKGSSGVLELKPIVDVVHVAEALLELAKDGDATLDEAAISELLEAMDQISAWIDGLDQTQQLPDDASDTGAAIAARLQTHVEQHNASVGDDTDKGNSEVEGEGISWGLFDEDDSGEDIADTTKQAEDHLPITLQQASSRYDARYRLPFLSTDKPLYWLRFQPDSDCFFQGDDPLLTLHQCPGLILYSATLTAQPDDLDTADIYESLLVFDALVSADKGDIETHFEYTPDAIELTATDKLALLQPNQEAVDEFIDTDTLNDLLQSWKQGDAKAFSEKLDAALQLTHLRSAQGELLNALSCLDIERDQVIGATVLTTLPQVADNQQSVVDWVYPTAVEMPDTTELPASDLSSSESVSPSAEQIEYFELNDEAKQLVADQLKLLQYAADDLKSASRQSVLKLLHAIAKSAGQVFPAAFEQGDLEDHLKHWLEVEHKGSRGSFKRLAASEPAKQTKASPQQPAIQEQQSQSTKQHASSGASASANNQVIRNFKVDQVHIASLGDLVGELVVAKNALPFLAERAEQTFGQRQLGREIREQYNVINRITRSLQDTMMQVQLLPVSHVFQRFPRLVRDLSKKLGKNIKLVIEGEQTEAEKSIIESLADPLVHLMRNSIDHGIEMPDERVNNGKPDTGYIRLAAWQENEWVVIEVADDGAGINPNVIKEKALEKCVISGERLANLSDQEAIELIFAAGFSSRDKASDLSGRGVGMDVVKSSVEKVGGELSVESHVGEGSRFLMRLPLSMSVSHVMQVWINEQRYGIPIEHVAETVRIPLKELHQFKDKQTVTLRDEVLPVISARDALALPEDEAESAALLIVKVRGEKAALRVDEFNEGVEVILKPMEGALETMEIYQGTALLGDGSVLLVLNINQLL